MNCDSTSCTNEATGAVRMEFFPHLVFQRLDALSQPVPLQRMVLGLYVCPECFRKTQVTDIVHGPTLEVLYQHAMQANGGIVPDRTLTRLTHIPLNDPELVLLQRTREAKQSGPLKETECPPSSLG